MNRLQLILACIVFALNTSPASAENRRAEIEPLLSALRLPEAGKIADEWLAKEEGTLESVDLASALETAAAVRLLKGDPPASLRVLVDRALAIRTKIAGADDPTLASAINLLGSIAFRATDYRGSANEYRKALALQRQDTATLADTLAGLGQATGFGGDPRAAVPLVERALAIWEAAAGPHSLGVAETLNLLGSMYYQGGDAIQAEAHFLKARNIVEDLYGPDHFLAAQVDGGLATLYKERAEFTKARGLHEHVILVYVALLGPEHPRLIAQYNNLGLCLKELGDLKGARAALETALRISEKTNGPEASSTASVLGNLGIALKESGDFDSARTTYERALAIQEKRLGPDHALVGAILFSLGSLLADMGDAANGKQRMERALAITDKALGPGSVRGVQIMDQFGQLLANQKDFKGARAIFERAWNESLRVYGENNSHTAAALASLAGLYAATKDFSGARERYRQALRVQEHELGPQHYYTLETVFALARTEQEAGLYAAALVLFERVSAEWRKQFGELYPSLADSIGHSAECLYRLGRRDEALKAALESATIRRTNIEIATHASGEREALLYAAKERTGLDLAIRLASTGGLPPASVKDVWDAVIRERALVLDEMAERHSIPEAAELAGPVAQVKAAREELARAVVRGPESNQREYAARFAELQTRVDQTERELASRSKRFLDHQTQTRRGFEELRASMKTGEALVAYARHSGSYVAFVLRAGEQFPHVIALAKAGEIDEDVVRWRREIERERDAMGRAAAANEVAYRTSGTALRRAIWDPLAGLLSGSKTIYLVGDGALQLVNFLALPSGPASYLVESGPELRMISSEKDIAEPHRPRSGALLAVGGPAFDARPKQAVPSARRGASCEAFRKLDFAALPGSGEEAREVARIGQKLGFESRSLRGEEATEGAFKNDAPGKAIVHVATHGFFLGSRCVSETESPLLRAGLAFAGANRRASAISAGEDGILTAEEVASLDFESAELVVLSGCDTGAGEVQTGEGVLGLRRAFRIAGARTLVMSLWPVDDQETRRWMANFYETYLARKLSAAASVRSASQTLLRERRAAGQSTHPFHWAGFIAVGN